MNLPSSDRQDYLKRLPGANYLGNSHVHWTMTIEGRKTGWLTSPMYYKFRELLTHTLFRYGLCSPIFCCMPDHMHLLWVGLFEWSDQLRASKYFRKQMNAVLRTVNFALQAQAHDHVLNEAERTQTGLTAIIEYIARNPERAGLVGPDQFRSYRYTDCLFPGYPEVRFAHDDYWDRCERIMSYLRQHGLHPPQPSPS